MANVVEEEKGSTAQVSLVGKVAFITGGGSGIGLHIAVWFLSRGASVVAIDADTKVNANILAAVEETDPTQLVAVGTRLATDVVDVIDWSAQARAFKWAVEQFKKIDYVVPCAGIGERPWLPRVKVGETGDYTKPDLSVLDVDLTGVLYTVSLAIQQFARQGFGGQIVIISSICGIYSIPGFPIYTAAKHALVGLTSSYAPALKQSNILINAICPAIVRTGISTSAFYDKMDALGMLTPMETILSVMGDRVIDQESTGNLYECGPNGVKVRGADEVDYADKTTEALCKLLENRAQGSFDVTSD